MQILVILCIFLKSWSFAESNKVFRNNKLNDYAKVSQLNLKNDIIQADIAVGNVIQALEKIAFYYLKHKKEMTVDFAFGLRAAEGMNVIFLFFLFSVYYVVFVVLNHYFNE